VSVPDHPVRSAFALQIQEVLGTRLSISSQSSIKTVISKWWLPFLGVLGSALPFEGDFIPAGHQSRGHLMAAFALHMAHKGLKYGTIQGYIWCLCERHIQQHGIHCNPLDNVVDWSRYMSALDVQAFVDSTAEPTKMVPFQLFSRTLAVLNKQDRRSKRTREDPDQREWRPVGEATGILSMRYWTDQYLVHGKRPKLWSNPDDPLFVHADRSVLTYRELMDSFRAAMERVDGVSPAEAAQYGLHGMRVLGYNCWRAANGEDVAKLQGGWGSDVHRMYGRDTLDKILSFAQKGATYAAKHSLPPMPLDAPSGEQTPPGDVYEVDRILDEKDGVYLVRWAGYGSEEDSWETHSNLAECAMDTVKDFQFRRKLESFGYNFT